MLNRLSMFVMLDRVIKTIIAKIRRLKRDRATQMFILHNKRVFPLRNQNKSGAPVVLFELTGMHSCHIAYSYLANVLARQHDAEIRAYTPNLHSSLVRRLIMKCYRIFRINEFGVYPSFGACQSITPALSHSQIRKADKIFVETFEKIKSKSDIESIAINDVWVGDLIYDTFLMNYKKPTIVKESQEFKDFLLNSIQLFVFWEDYMNGNDVKAINVSHCVYNLAIPLRIAVKKGIPAFHVHTSHGYRLNSRDLFAYSDFFYFRERFSSLPIEVREAGLKEAEFRIKRRFSGEIGVDMGYSTKSAYGEVKQYRLLKVSPRKKVLIATHCFFDSPHSYGNNLFPDFYEWLDFLGKMTQQTDYDWYIKTHPDYLPGTKEIIDSFVDKYPRFTLLPADSSHHQIIAEGIDVALTVWGTIGFEYAALGVPVINASLNNPHIAYEFNLHPKSIDEYRALLMNIDRLDLKIDKTQVYEYYFMRHIYNTEDWLFNNYSQMLDELGGYYEQFTSRVYEKWLGEWSTRKHNEILSALEKFIESGDFRMDYRHFGREVKADAHSCPK